MSSEVLQFGDLPDDCILLVFDQMTPDQLFKILRVNKRMNRFALAKLQSNATVMKFNTCSRPITTDCTHLDLSNPNRVLIWDSFFKETQDEPFHDLPKRAHFFRLLSICTNVKSVDFGSCWLPGHVLVEVALRCPALQCLKVGQSGVGEVEWIRVLDRIGPKIVHFAKQSTEDWNTSSEITMLKMIVAKCPNIKQIDWINTFLTIDLLATFKTLPQNCRIRFGCDSNDFGDIFDDIFDEFSVYFLTWSTFGDRVNRLSSLKLFLVSGYPVSVEFVGLKKLDAIKAESDYVIYLAESRFPRLEEFSFTANRRLTENVFDKMFKQMPSVKVLTIFCYGEGETNFEPRLPESSILRLKNLQTINLNIFPSKNWNPKPLFNRLEQYIDDDSKRKIQTLKKFNFYLRNYGCEDKLRTTIEKEVERVKAKQQNRVKIDLIFKN